MKRDKSVEGTPKVALFVLIGTLVSLEVGFSALVVTTKPTIGELNIIIPVLLTPVVGLILTILRYFLNNNDEPKQGISFSRF